MTARPSLELDTTWMEDARCAGINPDLFFPARGDTRSHNTNCSVSGAAPQNVTGAPSAAAAASPHHAPRYVPAPCSR
jgi:hypothetical protein